ncbi:hypothetical protein DY000_02018021 [Brassica cretica]|uniref:Transmembrane protein n=1 Tax=Brassica cretica TaxID=69181 RepID=A0ABQ7D7S6_BRACR|nr:hypothetical protein DY000_02018021 [Brassica cretica]
MRSGVSHGTSSRRTHEETQEREWRRRRVGYTRVTVGGGVDDVEEIKQWEVGLSGSEFGDGGEFESQVGAWKTCLLICFYPFCFLDILSSFSHSLIFFLDILDLYIYICRFRKLS